MPERFTRPLSHPSEVTGKRRSPHWLRRLLVRLHAKRQTDAFADRRAHHLAALKKRGSEDVGGSTLQRCSHSRHRNHGPIEYVPKFGRKFVG
jgi:hypothetical protein